MRSVGLSFDIIKVQLALTHQWRLTTVITLYLRRFPPRLFLFGPFLTGGSGRPRLFFLDGLFLLAGSALTTFFLDFFLDCFFLVCFFFDFFLAGCFFFDFFLAGAAFFFLVDFFLVDLFPAACFFCSFLSLASFCLFSCSLTLLSFFKAFSILRSRAAFC